MRVFNYISYPRKRRSETGLEFLGFFSTFINFFPKTFIKSIISNFPSECLCFGLSTYIL